jgi:type VI protein secretion system component VasK
MSELTNEAAAKAADADPTELAERLRNLRTRLDELRGRL